MLKRSIIFTNAPLLKGFKYRDLFQLVPIYHFSGAPKSAYMTHFPAFLEYKTSGLETNILCEQKLIEYGVSEEDLCNIRRIPEEVKIRKEILYLLSALTNFHFFEYNTISGSWGIQCPTKKIEELDENELVLLNNQTSSFYLKSYLYTGLKEDLVISEFTNCHEYYVAIDQPKEYFTIHPNIESNSQIKIPCYLDCVLDKYYSLEKGKRKSVLQCLGLLSEGIELFDSKRSVSLLSITSSIEGIAKLDDKFKNLKPTKRFLEYLKCYVSGKSEDKFYKYYLKRCEIAHEGILFLSDFDLYGDINKQDNDYLFRLEVMQVARLALFTWLMRM